METGMTAMISDSKAHTVSYLLYHAASPIKRFFSTQVLLEVRVIDLALCGCTDGKTWLPVH